MERLKRLSLLMIALMWALSLIWPGSPAGAQGEALVLHLSIRGPVTPTMADYLARGLAEAQRLNAEALIFQLNTPGGDVSQMNRVVETMLASEVPIVVYIAPPGALAASAGTVIALAGHAAAMAPDTAIGAASPVGGGGEDLPETLDRKLKETLKAQVRSLAERRGPDAVAMAEAAIEEARSASAQEAARAGMIDLVAPDLTSLLEQLDGLRVEIGGQSRRLNTAQAQVREFPLSFVEQVLQRLSDPNLVAILLTVGVQAILIEFSSPGGWIAGFIGVVCLALGIYGLGVLPVNWIGLIFLLTAFVLFLLEVKAATHGALAVAGTASLIAGLLVLFNSPGSPDFARVSVPLAISIALITAALFLIVVSLALRALRRPVTTGIEGLIGRHGQVRTAFSPLGKVFVAGELWSARLPDDVPSLDPGQMVEVVEVYGLQLQVRPLTNDSDDQPP